MNKVKKSKKSEISLAKKVNGKRTLRSGGLWFQKGDVVTADYLFEDKITQKSVFCLEKSILDKITSQSKKYLKTPVLHITFQPANKLPIEVVVLNIDCFKDVSIFNRIDIFKYNKSFDLTYDLCFKLLSSRDRSCIELKCSSDESYIIILTQDFIEMTNGAKK